MINYQETDCSNFNSIIISLGSSYMISFVMCSFECYNANGSCTLKYLKPGTPNMNHGSSISLNKNSFKYEYSYKPTLVFIADDRAYFEPVKEDSTITFNYNGVKVSIDVCKILPNKNSVAVKILESKYSEESSSKHDDGYSKIKEKVLMTIDNDIYSI